MTSPLNELKASFVLAADAVIAFASAKYEREFRSILTSPGHRDLLMNGWSEAVALPPVAAFLSDLRKAALQGPEVAPGLKEYSDNPNGMDIWLDGYVRNMFATLVYPLFPDVPGMPRIEAFWEGVREGIFGTELTVIETILINSFECEADHIDLEDGLELRQLSSTEAEDRFVRLRNTHGILVFQPKWELRWEYSATRREYQHGESRTSKLAAAQLAFRLLKAGGIDFRYWRHRSKFPLGYGGTRFREDEQPAMGEVYRLLDSEVDSLTNLYSKIVASNFAGFTPAKRFQSSYHERALGDRLAELAIALEGLLAPDKGENITYRLSLRGAKLLGDKAEREPLFKKLKVVYSLRSTVLHGGDILHDADSQKKINKHATSLGALVQDVEELCRHALRQRLLNPDQFKAEALDRLLLE